MTLDGDAQARAHEIEEFLRPLHDRRDRFLRFVRRRTNARPDARRDPEDILQAAFVKAIARRAEFERSGLPLDVWFYRVLNDVFIDDCRYHGRQTRDRRAETGWPDHSSVQAALGLHGTDTSPSEAVGRREVRERVERVLRELTPDHQEIMALIHDAELTAEDAAVVLGIEGNAVRQRYARARFRFRAAWKAIYGEDAFG
jgi:RNA polymerase sigma factor (sigma-70 family)